MNFPAVLSKEFVLPMPVKLFVITLLIIGLMATTLPAGDFDVVIYGGTSAAVTAAVEAKQAGKSVVIVSPDKHLGGLSSGGLGWTDTGNKAVIGGLAREFYHRVWKHYQTPAGLEVAAPRGIRRARAGDPGRRWCAAHNVDF